jgi:uncharacterized protein
MNKAKTLPFNSAPIAKAPGSLFPPGTTFVDGPNIDMVLGDILGRQPRAEDRPRWDRVLKFCRTSLRCNVCEFVFNGNKFDGSSCFALYRALHGMGWSAKCPRDATTDPVDGYICHRVHFYEQFRDGVHIVLLSHDHGYAPYLRNIMKCGGHVTIIGFREWLAPALLALESAGAEFLDLEYDVRAFLLSLNRPWSPPGR